MEHELDAAVLDDAALADLVAGLVAEERHLSARRTTLHQRIDFLRGGGYAHLDASVDHLRELEDEERAVSDRRSAIHAMLDRALAERRRRSGRTASPTSA